MTISKRALEGINEDQRLSENARQVLFMLFGYEEFQARDDFKDVDGVDLHALRRIFRELEDAHYILRGNEWKLQTGGHLMLFDRDQYPLMPLRGLPKLPPPAQGGDVVYVIGQPHSAVVKIGVTGNVRSRLKAIQTGSPVPLKVLWWHPANRELESQLHEEFRYCRLEGEWFDFGVEEPVDCVQMTVQTLRPQDFPGLEEEKARLCRETIASCEARERESLNHVDLGPERLDPRYRTGGLQLH